MFCSCIIILEEQFIKFQVRLVYKDDEENIPNFDDIFRDDEDEEVRSIPGLLKLE